MAPKAAYDINEETAKLYLASLVKALKENNTLKELSTVSEKSNNEKVYQKIQAVLNAIQLMQNDENSIGYQKQYKKLHEAAAQVPFVQDPNNIEKPDLKNFHIEFFKALYENENKLQENIAGKLIKEEENSAHPNLIKVKRKMTKSGVSSPNPMALLHPEHGFSKLFQGVFGIGYNPLKNTNKPYEAFKDENRNYKMLRFGAQIKGAATVQPAFLNYLAVKKSQNKKEENLAVQDNEFSDIHHIYINLLKRNDNNFEARQEHKRTKALEKINDLDVGAMVVTLPADHPFFFEGFNKKTGEAKGSEKYNLNQFLKSIEKSIKEDKNDFFVPESIKTKLFDSNEEETDGMKFQALFDASCKSVLGENYDKNTEINAEARQAILFDFVKFELSKFIVETVNPKTINCSCKDAIDRGGVHALWMAFKESLSSNKPMDRATFEANLDASALLVKGRPVNDHRHVIWNVMKESYLNNPQQYKDVDWVKFWVAENVPMDKKTLKAYLAEDKTAKEHKQVDVYIRKTAGLINQIEKVSTQAVAPKVDTSPSDIKVEKKEKPLLAKPSPAITALFESVFASDKNNIDKSTIDKLNNEKQQSPDTFKATSDDFLMEALGKINSSEELAAFKEKFKALKENDALPDHNRPSPDLEKASKPKRSKSK